MKDIVQRIREAEHIAIVTHASPDGDAVGSSLALAQGVRGMGKKVTLISKEPVPENLLFLAMAEEYGARDGLNGSEDLLVCLDCGNVDRLSMEREGFPYIFKINIDHHVSNEYYGDLNWVERHASSTSELVHALLQGLEVPFTPSVAEALYTGIVADTGSFRFPSTTPRTHAIAGELIGTGFDFSALHRVLFSTRDVRRLKLMAKAVTSLETFQDGFVSVMYLTAEDFNALNIPDRDAGEIVNLGLEPKEADISILMKESEGLYRVSIRTKSSIDASALCAVFGGGGHLRAAGCNVKADSFGEVTQKLLTEIERMRKS